LELNTLELFECKPKTLQCPCPLSVNKTEGKIICKRYLGRLLDNLQIVSQSCVVKKSVKTETFNVERWFQVHVLLGAKIYLLSYLNLSVEIISRHS